MVDQAAAIVGMLNRIEQRLERGTIAPRFKSVADTVVYAGLSADSIRRLVERGDLTAYRSVKGKIVLDIQEVDSFILGSTNRPQNGRGAHLHNSTEPVVNLNEKTRRP